MMINKPTGSERHSVDEQRRRKDRRRRRRRRWRRMKMNLRQLVASSSVILVLQFTASSTQFTSVIVRPGGEATLPCENAVEPNCASTTWLFSRSPQSPPTVLVRSGRVAVAGSEPERLRVAANCSLVLKAVTEKDVGRYGCRYDNMSVTQRPKDSLVELSVINMTKKTKSDGKRVKYTCSVTTYGNCSLAVTWLYFWADDDDHERTDSACSTTVSYKAYLKLDALSKFLICTVTDRRTDKVEEFTFNSESSGNNKSEAGNQEKKPPLEDPQQQLQWWWYFALAVVALAVVVLSVVALVMWRGNKGNKSETEETMADPEEGVAYASINHRSGISSQIRGGDCTVTYSTVAYLSSSPEPSNLYATVNKPQK